MEDITIITDPLFIHVFCISELFNYLCYFNSEKLNFLTYLIL